ncbi:MAG TPA: bifunctional [glutamate--ammonia ligase]-adenylyl-L-tyrosine phosphorylase/[glutamate--ammonia-ligase] adenylyltransferase [Candidatus Binataceae bacterium]|nr:bifunctional [glutamate--ammonia ligase]-adenylyl-L-tyrosine phosphorylase/[glutamate--ammonia-ligase] adenylyltransferase [Candidatus Binataceae bacterium]
MDREFGARLSDLKASLARRLGDDALAERAQQYVADRAPDERLALIGLLELAERSPKELAGVLTDETLGSDLVFCLGSSEVVALGLAKMAPGWVDFLAAAREITVDSPAVAFHHEVVAGLAKADAAQAVGEFKRLNFLAIAIADLLGQLDVVATMELMSRLAEECIRAALEYATNLAGEDARRAGEICILAMGKLGARELNLSSDIDLVYVFEGVSPTPEAVIRQAEACTEILQSGAFRVDLRLRPGGRSSPLVIPVEGALSFYESYGQTWERAALLRARPVGGSLEVGNRLLTELNRFIFRRYLDFDTTRELRAMKGRIERELRSPEMVRRNIKLGYGGIRELEFIVQALTLIYGGRDPRLRTGQTLSAIGLLEMFGYLDASNSRILAEAYLFLRNVEHKLQVVADRQTHVLPADQAGIDALAARMRFGKGTEAVEFFASELKHLRDFIAERFREMLGSALDRDERPAPEPSDRVWRAAAEPARSAPLLADLGFVRPAESAAHLMELARGPAQPMAAASPRRRELLDYLGPRLLDEIRTLPDPDLALMNLVSFVAAVGARTSFLALLEQHPATRQVLLRLFASSRYLSSLFIRHPDMLDTLVRSDLGGPHRARAELESELRDLIAASPDIETRLDAIRTFRHQEFLRIAIADVAGDLDLDAVQSELATIAEVVLAQALALAREEVGAVFEIAPTLEIAALAMGRLGAAEMSYNSDLDLIFVYHDRREVAESSRVAASKIVQKLISILETRTREGFVYKIDLRLRPSGNAGPLVASLEGFREYHRKSAAVWERQALVRARVVAGDPDLAAEVEAARRETVFSRGLSPAEAAEVAAMRDRIDRELGQDDRRRLNIKQGRGGLVDVEFMTQLMAMRYGRDHPELRARGTVALVRALAASGLIPTDEAETLESGYRFLSQLENRLRIESDQAAWALSIEPESLAPLARRMGFESVNGAAQLIAEVEACRDRIRAAFERRVGAEISRTA